MSICTVSIVPVWVPSVEPFFPLHFFFLFSIDGWVGELVQRGCSVKKKEDIFKRNVESKKKEKPESFWLERFLIALLNYEPFILLKVVHILKGFVCSPLASDVHRFSFPLHV